MPSFCKSQWVLPASFLSTVCLLWIVPGCAGSSTPLIVVCGTCEEPGRFVRLQTQDPQSLLVEHGTFSHPLQLSSRDWKPVLANIRVRPLIHFLMKGEGEPAFTPEEIDYLSITLSRAFAAASSREWVVFGLGNTNSGSVPTMTTGAWYAAGTTLHLLLPNFHARVPSENLADVLGHDPLFEVLEATRYEFLPTEYSENRSEKTSLAGVLREEVPHLAIDYHRIVTGDTFSNARRQ